RRGRQGSSQGRDGSEDGAEVRVGGKAAERAEAGPGVPDAPRPDRRRGLVVARSTAGGGTGARGQDAVRAAPGATARCLRRRTAPDAAAQGAALARDEGAGQGGVLPAGAPSR